MMHVACRVTVDATLPEASPVEAALIQTDNIIRPTEHADTREGQATCTLGLLKINPSVVLGLHREAQGASLSAFPVGGMTRACFMSSPLPLDVCKHTFFSRSPLRTIGSKHCACGCAPQSPTDGGASAGRSHLGFASSLAEPHTGGREDAGNPWQESGCREVLAWNKRHDPWLCHSRACDFDFYSAGVARSTPSALRRQRRATLQDNVRPSHPAVPPCDSYPIRTPTRRCWHREVPLIPRTCSNR